MLSVSGVLLLVVLTSITLYIIRHHEYKKRYVASFLIVASHVQTLSIIGSMRLKWPLLVVKVNGHAHKDRPVVYSFSACPDVRLPSQPDRSCKH